MDTTPTPFVPPAPKPRTTPPSLFEMIRIVYRNPLELWGEPILQRALDFGDRRRRARWSSPTIPA